MVFSGACKALSAAVRDSSEVAELSKDFVMVNCEDEEEPHGDQYTPDGGYYPRTLFLDGQGNVLKELYNTHGNEEYKYYYGYGAAAGGCNHVWAVTWRWLWSKHGSQRGCSFFAVVSAVVRLCVGAVCGFVCLWSAFWQFFVLTAVQVYV